MAPPFGGGWAAHDKSAPPPRRETDGSYMQLQLHKQTGNGMKVELERAEGLRWNDKAAEREYMRNGSSTAESPFGGGEIWQTCYSASSHAHSDHLDRLPCCCPVSGIAPPAALSLWGDGYPQSDTVCSFPVCSFSSVCTRAAAQRARSTNRPRLGAPGVLSTPSISSPSGSPPDHIAPAALPLGEHGGAG